MNVEARARWLFTAFLGLVAAGAGVWMLAGWVRFTTYEIRSADAVSGLIPGAPVEFHGVEVGKVKAVELLAPRMVRVLLDVGRDVPVSSATVATITGRGLATRGFTGYVYVSLEDAAALDNGRALEPAPGSPYPLLASAPARQVSLDTSMQQINDNVQAVSALLRGALDAQMVASLRQSLAGLDQVTHTLAANNDRLARIIANADRASAGLQPLLQAGDAAARQVGGTAARMDRLSTSLDERMARITPLLQASEEAVRTLETQVLPQAQRTLVRLDQLSTSLGDAAGRVERNPALLVRGTAPRPPGPGEGP